MISIYVLIINILPCLFTSQIYPLLYLKGFFQILGGRFPPNPLIGGCLPPNPRGQKGKKICNSVIYCFGFLLHEAFISICLLLISRHSPFVRAQRVATDIRNKLKPNRMWNFINNGICDFTKSFIFLLWILLIST